MNKPTAFIIEDDARLSEILNIVLQQAGFSTEIVNDGAKAQARLETISPTLILLDLHLPSVPGVKLLQDIRADSRLAHTPVIIVTADVNLAQSVKEQADHVLIKPMGISSLRAIVTRLHPDTLDTPE